MSRSLDVLAFAAAGCCFLIAPAQSETLGLGRPALPEEIAAWDVSVLPDGSGLPEGSGDVSTGDEVFAEKCAACHGDFAEGIDNWPVLAGGSGTLKDRRPVKTIGSYWPYVSTVWDYVHRSMPFGAAQTITADEAYAITAFLLFSNGLAEDDFVLSKDNFAEVTLPNVGGFYPDDREQTEYPHFSLPPCMSDCREPVKVTKRAIELNVTPTDPDGRPAGTLPDLHLAEAGGEATAPDASSGEAADPALIEAGAAVFKKCQACHKVGAGAKNATGPVLNGVVGRVAGSAEGFRYSKPMQAAGEGGLVWTADALTAFLANPKGYMAGTKMSFTGLKTPEDIAAVIAYLATQAE